MSRKQIIVITGGCLLCLVCGFIIGYGIGGGKIPGYSLTGADIRQDGNGMFIIDGQEMNLESMMMYLNNQNAETLDTQIEDQMKEIQKVNEKIRECNSIMAELRSCMRDNLDAPSMRVQDFFASNGISLPSGPYTKEEWGIAIDNLSSFMGSLTSSNELDMIRLQALVNKRNQMLQMMSNILKKSNDMKSGIIGNMR